MFNESHSIKRYFDERYPERRNTGNPVFRADETERIEAAQYLISKIDFESLLDIGCGDGHLLLMALSKKVSYIRVEDIVEKNVNKAKLALCNKADHIEAVAVDSLTHNSGEQYDLVTALGLTDYYQDWDGILEILLSKSKKYLVVDFPKSKTFHSFLRRMWLLRNNIKLHSITKVKLIKYLKKNNHNYEMSESRYNWMVLITK